MERAFFIFVYDLSIFIYHSLVRILHISSAKTFGGGERHFVDLCRGLEARRHQIFAALRPSNEWQKRLDCLPPENILHVSLRNSFGVLSATRIAEFIREKNIEIVHAHAARDYIPASLACRMAKTAKFVLTRHVLFPLKPVHRFTLNNLSKAIAVSKPVEVNLQNIFSKEKVVLVSNGIDVEALAKVEREKLREAFRFEHDIPFDAFLIGTIGELKALKGQRDFILAAQIVAQKFPDARFVIVGKDNSFKQDFRRELKRLVKIFRMEERFLWLDWAEDTAPLLAALDVFVSASHTESFGLAILEAMAIGDAIVATGTEGANELLQTNVSGKLVPVKEPIRLAEAIGEFLNDEQLRKKLGANAQATAKEKFGIEKMIIETEKIYQEVLMRK
ncbi:MAG TPA: glycosyltransferase family 4 protein [Pyrinomonadaceae bacterium]|nr:glycosyltransferase family 4 protein [Pyrinomonadaceae bacterium]